MGIPNIDSSLIQTGSPHHNGVHSAKIGECGVGNRIAFPSVDSRLLRVSHHSSVSHCVALRQWYVTNCTWTGRCEKVIGWYRSICLHAVNIHLSSLAACEALSYSCALLRRDRRRFFMRIHHDSRRMAKESWMTRKMAAAPYRLLNRQTLTAVHQQSDNPVQWVDECTQGETTDRFTHGHLRLPQPDPA